MRLARPPVCIRCPARINSGSATRTTEFIERKPCNISVFRFTSYKKGQIGENARKRPRDGHAEAHQEQLEVVLQTARSSLSSKLCPIACTRSRNAKPAQPNAQKRIEAWDNHKGRPSAGVVCGRWISPGQHPIGPDDKEHCCAQCDRCNNGVMPFADTTPCKPLSSASQPSPGFVAAQRSGRRPCIAAERNSKINSWRPTIDRPSR